MTATTTITPACPPRISPRRTSTNPPVPSEPPLSRSPLALARRCERLAGIATPNGRSALLARARDGYAAAGKPRDARRCAGLLG